VQISANSFGLPAFFFKINLFCLAFSNPPKVIFGGKLIWTEKREHKRIPLHFYLKVSEKGSSKYLGFMIDISKKGFKLLSEEKIPVGTELLCVLHLPEELNGKKDISFMARTCWCAKDVNPEYYASGYHFEDIEPDGDIILSTIMHYYGYNI
jgi:hypothetical protein